MRIKGIRTSRLVAVVVMVIGLVSISAGNVLAERFFDQSELLVAPTGSGTTYYVDGTNGNDSWDGKYATYQSGTSGPFKTIAKALDRYSSRIKGGNTIKIRAGLYRERVKLGNLAGAVSEDTRFVIGPYGDGEVVIDASDTHLLAWSVYPGNPQVYQADCDLKLNGSSTSPTAVILDDNFKSCRPVYRLEDVTSFGRWYYDSTAKKLYVHTNGNDPLKHDIVVVKSDRNNVDYGVYLTGNYVTVYGLTVRGASSYGIHGLNDYNRIEKCTAKYSGKAGIKIYGVYAELLKNHVYGNAILNWPRGNTWDTSGGWPNGMTGSGYAHIAGNLVHDNGGEGIGSMSGPGGVVIEDNISYDNWSVNIYLDNQPNDIVRRNLVYCSGVKESEAIDADRVPSWTTLTKIYKRMRPEGIMSGDETASNAVAQSVNHKIYNNLIINCAKGYSHYGQATGAGLRNFVVANNTIILPRDPNQGSTWVGLDLPYHNGNNSGTVVKNNIVVGFRSDTPLVNLSGGASEQGVTLDYNLYFNGASNSTFQTGSYPSVASYTMATWKSDLGRDIKGSFADPQFARLTESLIDGNFHLLNGSPAVGLGDTSLMQIVADDYDMAGRINGYVSAGAFEFVSDVDNIAPIASISALAVTGTSDLKYIKINASDNKTVNKVELYLNGVLIEYNYSNELNYLWNSSAFANGDYLFYAKVYDTAGNVGQSELLTLNVNRDTEPPVILDYNIPSFSSSLTVPVTGLVATDDNKVSAYLVTESVTVPTADALGWSSSVPTSFTFTAEGTKTAYAWAKDDAGNISASLSRTVTITLPDITSPTVTAFSLQTASTTLSVPVSGFTATDAKGVTGYLITETSGVPAASAAGWTATAPTSFTFSAAGSRVAYAWAKDAAGNISTSVSKAVTITLPDTTAPTVAITSPSNNSTFSGTTSITASASDNVKVSKVEFYVGGTLKGTSTVAPYSCSWSSSGYAAGSYAVYAKAYDAAGNMKQSATVSVKIGTISNRKKGDLNNDGTINVADALYSLRKSVGLTSISVAAADDELIGDVAPLVDGIPVGDGAETVADALLILRNAVGVVVW